jgi:tetratricopeptide (TPR) repeat protein
MPAHVWSHPKLEEAQLARASGDFALALACIGEALRDSPDNAEAYIFRADLLLSRDKIEAAKADIAHAEVLDHDPKDLYRLRAELAIAEKDLDGALDIADMAFDATEGKVRLWPWISMALFPWRLREGLLLEKWHDFEMRICERWLAKAPTDAFGRDRLAQQLAQAKKPDFARAMQIAEELVLEDPEDADRQRLLGEMSLGALELGKSEAAFVRTVELGKDPKEMRSDIGKLMRAKTRGRLLTVLHGEHRRPNHYRVLGALLFLVPAGLLAARQVKAGLLALAIYVLAAATLLLVPGIATIRVKRHAAFASLADRRTLTSAYVMFGLYAVLAGLILSFPFAPSPVRAAILAGCIGPVGGILGVSTFSDMFDNVDQGRNYALVFGILGLATTIMAFVVVLSP